MDSCGMSVIKYLLFIFNLIFAISGIGIIAAGALVLTDVGKFNHFLEGRILAPPVVLIVAGVIVFAIAFLGCYGAIKESYHMLMAFAVVLLMIFVIELAVGITAAVFKNDYEEILKHSMEESMTNYNETDQIAWEIMQKNLKCCGVLSSIDWDYATNSNYTKAQLLPPSCCKKIGPSNQCSPKELQNIHQMGCFDALEEKVRKSATILIGVGISIALVELAGIFFACRLAFFIKKEEEEN